MPAAKADPKTGKTEAELQTEKDKGLLQRLEEAVTSLTEQVTSLGSRQDTTDGKVKEAEDLWTKLFGPRTPPA